jgi:hypothetical protein
LVVARWATDRVSALLRLINIDNRDKYKNKNNNNHNYNYNARGTERTKLTLRSFRIKIFPVKKTNIITYSECGFSLIYTAQNAHVLYYIVIFSLGVSTIFFDIICESERFFGKHLLNTKCLLIFSTNFV